MAWLVSSDRGAARRGALRTEGLPASPSAMPNSSSESGPGLASPRLADTDSSSRAAASKHRYSSTRGRSRPPRPGPHRLDHNPGLTGAASDAIRRESKKPPGSLAGFQSAFQSALLRRENPRFLGGSLSTATGIRTRVSAMRGRRPSPLDDSGAMGQQASKARTRPAGLAGPVPRRAVLPP
jgi:hypothetical protein